MAEEEANVEEGAAEEQAAENNNEGSAQEQQASDSQEHKSLLADDKPEEGGEDSAESPDEEEGSAEPVEYEDFKMPDGLDADLDFLEAFKKEAGEMRLSQESAQKLVDVYTARHQSFVEAQQKQMNELIAQQTAEVQSLPESEKVLALAKKGLTTVFGEKAQALLTENPVLGTHAELIQGLAEVGKLVSEDNFQEGTVGGGEKSLADRLYGSK